MRSPRRRTPPEENTKENTGRYSTVCGLWSDVYGLFMRIAIASSGLGHVARGIETWACDTAVALSQTTDHRLQTTDPGEESKVESSKSKVANPQRSDVCGLRSEVSFSLSVTLFCAASLALPTVNCPLLTVHVIPCLQRGNPITQQLSNFFPKWAWRWGLKSAYDLEQWSFWWKLWPELRRGKFDIVHVQDPWLALLLERSGKWGWHPAKVILAHGTEEPLEFLEKFEYVQHLAPWHMKETTDIRPKTADQKKGDEKRLWTAMPNFVDCAVFRPAEDRVEKQAIRRLLGIPEDAFVVGCVAAVKKEHKRIDHLIREFARLARPQTADYRLQTTDIRLQTADQGEEGAATTTPSPLRGEGWGEGDPERAGVRVSSPQKSVVCGLWSDVFLPPFLLIAGAKTSETAELLALAESLIPGRYKIVTDCSRSQMPDIYRAMDVFVLPSLFEMMPIALLEALASGVPCLVNKHPVLEWMIGACGADQTIDHRPSTADQEEEGSVLVTPSPLRGEGGGEGGQNQENTPHLNPLPQGERKDLCEAPSVLRSDVCGLKSDVSPAPGGMSLDMSQAQALSQALARLTPEWLASHGLQARERAVKMFSTEAVIGQYVEYYKKIVGCEMRRGVPRRHQTIDHRPQT